MLPAVSHQIETFNPIFFFDTKKEAWLLPIVKRTYIILQKCVSVSPEYKLLYRDYTFVWKMRVSRGPKQQIPILL